MLTSYLRSALRNLYRDKYYALINITGLSIALACCLILGIHLKSELTYDQHNVQYKRIFRVVNLLNNNGFIEDFSRIPQLIGPLLAQDHPEVETYVRFQKLNTTLIRQREKAFYQRNMMFAEPNVFAVFTHQIIAGDPETALIDPYSIAISESFAKTYFGDDDPMGQTLSTDSSDYRVSLVYADLPENSHFRYDALLSFNRLSPLSIADLSSEQAQRSLGSTSTFTYLVMPEDYDVDEFEAISDSFWERRMAARFGENTRHRYYLEPLADIHLHSTTLGDEPRGNSFTVYAFSIIGIFILLVACINYINLATARSAKRAKEVGLRKVLGSSQSQLIGQFLGEAMLFSLLAVPLALIWAELALTLTPVTNLLSTNISPQSLVSPTIIVSLVIAALVLGLLSGLYPAFSIAAMKPLPAIKGSDKSSGKNVFSRQLLVLLQFTISIGVIACTLLMYSQMQYFHDKSLGFNKENKLVLQLRTDEVMERMSSLEGLLLQNPQILAVTTSSSLPGGGFRINAGEVENNDGSMETRVINYYAIDENYLAVMDMELVEGRNFNSAIQTDFNAALIVNETTVKNMGWDEAIGKNVFGLRVIGVVADFNFHDLSRELESLAFQFVETSRYLTVSISGERIFETIDYLRDVWREFDPDHPFEFEFLDDSLDRLYESEQQGMTLIGIFAGLCIFISCLGLLGLTAFTTEQRSRELGIRKVLGATPIQLIFMLFKNVFIIVLIAAVIASAISFSIISRWLEGFAYHVEINFGLFVLASLSCVFIAFTTMAIQSWKTTRSNPIDALRYE